MDICVNIVLLSYVANSVIERLRTHDADTSTTLSNGHGHDAINREAVQCGKLTDLCLRFITVLILLLLPSLQLRPYGGINICILFLLLLLLRASRIVPTVKHRVATCLR